ncbi:MAG: 16S rRNA (guanine(527)-N(7))-methyltransferase RsmG [Proteobacteria bacterium]|nr:16S rRNA (guanine(527)-N(7))-methyltransferase RsmG [Pseudomonadota bacterium]
MTPAATLARGLEGLGLTLPDDATRKLLAYVELLAKWNRTYNLTAIREPERMVSHHLIDSLSVLPHLPAGTLVDVGSGGGLPGIPIAIAQPGRRVTLNDSNHKKGAFMQQAAIELGLANVEVHTGRAEDWRPDARFDGAISRAFAELADFIAACRHLVKPEGFFAAMKGLYPHDEVAKVPAGVRCAEPIRLSVPLVDGDRHLVLCRVGG